MSHLQREVADRHVRDVVDELAGDGTEWFVTGTGKSAHRSRDCGHVDDDSVVACVLTETERRSHNVRKCSDCGYPEPPLLENA